MLLLTLAHIYTTTVSDPQGQVPTISNTYNIKHPQSQAPTIASVAGNSSLLKYCILRCLQELLFLICFVFGQPRFSPPKIAETPP